MADRTSADVFGVIFALLASGKGKAQIAKALWKESFRFDFSPEQMGVDRALKKLGLAREVKAEYDYTREDGSIGVEKCKETQYRSKNLRGWDE